MSAASLQAKSFLTGTVRDGLLRQWKASLWMLVGTVPPFAALSARYFCIPNSVFSRNVVLNVTRKAEGMEIL